MRYIGCYINDDTNAKLEELKKAMNVRTNTGLINLLITDSHDALKKPNRTVAE